MTLNEILKSKGLNDDQITEVLNDMKTNKIFTASEENLDVRYGKLKTDHDALVAKDGESQKLIADLQKATKDNEGIQSQITQYQKTIQAKDEQMKKLQIESEVKIALLGAGAKEDDLEYLMFKMTSGEWKPELDDSGKLKGLDEKIEASKKQHPTQFEGSSTKKIDEKKLEKQKDDVLTVTKEDFDKMGYASRVAFKQSNPEAYEAFTK